MHSPRASLLEFGSRRTAFSVVVLVSLGLVAFISVVLLKPNLVTELLGHDTAGHISQHFRQPHHRVHDLTFSFIFGTAVVGMLAQLWRPSENVAAQLMALIPWVALGLASALSVTWIRFAPAPILAALTLLAIILHPTGGNFFRSFSVSRVNRVLLALVTIATVPLVAFAHSNIRLQAAATNDHAALGHYGFMAAFTFTVIGVGLLASLHPDGWRITAWVAGFLPALLGLTSLVFSDVDSSLSLRWALAAIAWGVTFVAASESIRRGSGTRPGSPGDAAGTVPDPRGVAETPNGTRPTAGSSRPPSLGSPRNY
jgi:hypothetical protein